MKRILSGLMSLALFFVSCQTKYDVGISKVSIEPTDETVSLTLAGYASPYLGRFTLTWEDQGDLQNVLAMTQLQEEIYFVDGKGEFSVVTNADPGNVRKLGYAGNIKYLAGYKESLFGLAADG